MLGGTKQRPSAGGSASRIGKWGCAGAAAHPHRASSSMDIYDHLQVTKSGVGLSHIQHFCSLVTILCSLVTLLCSNNSGMRVAPILLGYGSCRSASPASSCLCISCLIHFQLFPEAQFPRTAQRLLTRITPTCIYTAHFIKKGFNFLIFAHD